MSTVAQDHPSHRNGKVPSVDSPPEKRLTGAHARAAALKATNPVAYSHYARYTDRMLEADMDRPPAGKSKGWVSINSEEVRIKADIIRHSGMWPICMPHAVLTLGDYGLTYQQAARQGMRLGDDEGQYTFVLDENGEPKSYTQAWICRNLGMKRQNVSRRVKHMALKKILIIGDKGLTVDPAPSPLTEAERNFVIQTDDKKRNFVIQTDDKIPQHLKEVLNGFKPSRSHLEILSKLPEVICLDYFHRLHDIHLESEKKLDAIRAEREKAMNDIIAEASILIEQVHQDVQGEASSSVEREQAEPKATTTTIPEPEPEEPSVSIEESAEPVPVLMKVLVEAFQLHPIGGVPSEAQVAEIVPLLPNRASPEVIKAYGQWLITEKLVTRKLKSIGGLITFTKEFARIYVQPPVKSAPRGPVCSKCGSHRSTIDGLCFSCSRAGLSP